MSSLDAPPTPTGSFTGSFTGRIHSRAPSTNSMSNHRAVSPPLEKDEREFTQTAQGMQKRQLSQDGNTIGSRLLAQTPVKDASEHAPEAEDTAAKNMEIVESLFGRAHMASADLISSPAVKPIVVAVPSLGKRGFEEVEWMDSDEQWDWDMRSPEHIALEELDGLFDDF